MAFDPKMAFRSCGYCGLKRAQMIVVSSSQSGETSWGDQRWHTFLRCPDCARITIIEHNGVVRDRSDNRIIRVDPEDAETASAVKHLPEDVEQYFKDARRVLDAGVPDAAAVQLRRTLEAAAAHFDVKERALIGSIKKLIERGLVTQPFADALHHIRLVGNQGAHASDERVDDATAEQAFRFTTQLLRNLFEVPTELQLLSADDGEGDEPDTELIIPPRSGNPS